MSASSPPVGQSWGLARRILPLAVIVILAGAGYFVLGDGGISLESLVRHRATIDTFVAEHRLLAVLAYIGIYIVAVALSLPGAAFLTVAGGFLFGLLVGASAAVIGATIGATVIFLVARTALGEPLLRRAGPRSNQLAKGFRDDAFSYLLFLRLVPAFPFFAINAVAGLTRMSLRTFTLATFIGIIPGSYAFAFLGRGLGSVLDAARATHEACVAQNGAANCAYDISPSRLVTPQILWAFLALGLLALVPVALKMWKRLQ